MAVLKDILYRTAANIGLEADELQPYADALWAIVEEAQLRGEDVELMTFGTIRAPGATPRFRPHPTLLPRNEGEDT